MTPEQALQILDQAARTFQGTREDHQNISMAIAVLQQVVSREGAAKKQAEMKSITEKEGSPAPEEENTEQKTEENAS